jgi:malonyl-CoA O-methyltransferase
MTQGWLDYPGGSESLPHSPTLFLPGWGFSGKILELAEHPCPWARPVAPLDPATALQDIQDFLAARRLETIRLVGWSMGASLACDFARIFPEKVTTLTVLGMRVSWPEPEIGGIRRALAADPVLFLRDFYRKSLLGYKKEFRRFAADQQEALMESLDIQALGRGLDYLSQWRPPGQGLQCPVFIWHGRRDIIAPVAQQAVIPGARATIIEHGGHALFLDREFVFGG